MKIRLSTILFSAIIFCLVFLIFMSSLGYDFVWDDREIIVNNLHIRAFHINNLLWAFTTTFGGHYQPLTWLSFILDYYVWGLGSYGFRLTNIVIHGINSILLMLTIVTFLKLVCKSPANHFLLLISAVVGTLIFSLHPLRVESVVWVTERRDVLSTFFLLISFLTYLCYKFQIDTVVINISLKKLYIISLCSFFLSLLCKAWGITFPVVLLLIDMAVRHPKEYAVSFLLNSIKQKAIYIIIAVLFALIAVIAQKTSGAMVSWENLTLMDRVLQASYGFNMYLLHTLFPVDLSPLYLLGNTNFYDIKYYLHFLIFISIFIFCLSIRNKYPWPLTIFLIYLVIIFPVLGFSQSGPQIMADRYTYIALMPFSFVISFITMRGLEYISKQEKHTKIMLTCLMSLICIFIICALVNNTNKQILIWENEETLWSHAIDIDRSNYRALNNRADYRFKKKLFNKSFEDYSSVLELDSENAYALNGRAATSIHMGDLIGAIEDLNSALLIVPNNIDVLLNRGVANHNLGKADMARNDFQTIIKYLPEHVGANYNLGISYFSSNEFNKAISLFTNVSHVDPDHVDSIYYRGLSYLYIEDFKQARKDFWHVMSNVPKNTILYTNAEQQLNLLDLSEL